ncbi:non-specific lipid-transfer protein A-like [Populus alba x Populus x berolinensis]|uniref:non-specific lipid-transfer protein A n=1 Tax=Populus alba TaxID=43335 RepID=UPI001589CB09|nr:non-specific lipid-transfer protein A-like [Populus alba]KAJ6878982.1 non-specific lipid-transfer protein A-like [Populus alba x Populus x berolinensis]
MKGSGIISMLVVVAMVQFTVKPGEAITCGDVISDLAACVSYLTGKDGDFPPPPCCAGVSKLKASAVSIADKKAACECVKAAAARIPDLKDEAASSLPAKCKVQVDFPISKTFNCADIH